MGNTPNTTGKNGSKSTRAVALVGPAGTGKTSLAEALLYASGAITRQGTVEAGNTIGDSSPEARARKGSTELNLMHFDYLGDRFALIATPGAAIYSTGQPVSPGSCTTTASWVTPSYSAAAIA